MGKLKKGDIVRVISGDDKGKTGTIKQVFPKSSKAIVQGINLAKKHIKASQDRQGSVETIELAIHTSNLMFFDDEAKLATKLKVAVQDGKKNRVGKKTNKVY